MALIETNFIRPQEVYDRNTGESKVRYRSYDGNDRFIPVVEGENGVPKTLVEVTHAELKAMRDAGKLTPGALYRITDYNCTTTQENTQSAGHQFDIVLLALSEDKLAEEGWAMMHDNIYDVTFHDGVTKKCYLYFFDDDTDCNIVLVEDTTKGYNLGISSEDFINFDETNKTAEIGLSYYDDEHGDSFITIAEPDVLYNYFQNSNLSAWKVWYCLDNDKDRFAWADTTNGKGVIYRMIDEFNNDAPYDFKNIQKYMNMNEGSYAGSGLGNTWVYTFSLYDRDNELYLDGSLRLVEVVVDDTYVVARNNYIERFFGPMKQQIPCNLIVGHMSVQDEEGAIGINITIIKSYYAVVSTTFGNTIVIGSVVNGTNISTTGVYIEGKKVLTEE